MFTKSLIAAAALATVLAGSAATATTAQAKVNFDVHVNLGGPGFYPAHFEEDYGDCFYKKVKTVKWHNHGGGFVHKHIKWKKKLICY